MIIDEIRKAVIKKGDILVLRYSNAISKEAINNIPGIK